MLRSSIAVCALSLCVPVHAQWDDPEPDAEGGAILDPELEGVAPPPEPEPELPPVTQGPTGELRMVLRNRTAMDVFFQDPREDVLTSTFLASFEATVRQPGGTRFVVGARPIYRAATRAEGTADQTAERYQLDVLPSAAYADLNPSAGVHLRLGYQYLHLGRFDVFSAQNVLSAFDLRDGPGTMPEAAELAQPAVRVDWDPNLWLSLRAVYVPFFQPHVVDYTDGDYALAPQTQAEVEAAYEADETDPLTKRNIRNITRASIGRAGREGIVQSGFEAFAPDPVPDRPQGALRLVMHGPEGELGATVVTANERLPAPWYAEPLREVLDTPAGETPPAGAAGAAMALDRPVELRYNRFFVTAVDGATNAGPVQLGAELAMMWNRTFFAAQAGRVAVPEQVHVAQASVRAEYLLGSRLALVGEAFWATMLSDPSEPGRAWLMADDGRHLRGAILFASYAWQALDLTFELGAAAMSGPSYAWLPRVEWKATPALAFELGSQWLQGDKPRDLTNPNFSLGGRYDDTDQVFVGVRYLR